MAETPRRAGPRSDSPLSCSGELDLGVEGATPPERESLTLRAIVRKRLRGVIRFIGVGGVVGAGVGLLIQQIDGGPVPPHVVRGTAVGLTIGLLVGLGEEFVFVGRRLWQSYRQITVLRVALYTLAVVASLILVNGMSNQLSDGVSFTEGSAFYILSDNMKRDLIFALIVAVAGTAILEIRRLHNPGDIRGFLTGRYRFPVEERRIFLFADLAGSTPLAERLGAHGYSRFIGDCYRDMAEAILAWQGQVYQYVGDEIIVSWPFESRDEDPGAAAVGCFFDMRALLAEKSDRYREIYGCTPLFRGGIHGGSVVTTWVGLAKVDLAFHGDALNATARIQELCKERGEELLVSASTLDGARLPEGVAAHSLGPVALRGLEEAVEILALREAPAQA